LAAIIGKPRKLVYGVSGILMLSEWALGYTTIVWESTKTTRAGLHM